MRELALAGCRECGNEEERLDMFTVFAPSRPPVMGESGHGFTGEVRDQFHICPPCWESRTSFVIEVREGATVE